MGFIKELRLLMTTSIPLPSARPTQNAPQCVSSSQLCCFFIKVSKFQSGCSFANSTQGLPDSGRQISSPISLKHRWVFRLYTYRLRCLWDWRRSGFWRLSTPLNPLRMLYLKPNFPTYIVFRIFLCLHSWFGDNQQQMDLNQSSDKFVFRF